MEGSATVQKDHWVLEFSLRARSSVKLAQPWGFPHSHGSSPPKASTVLSFPFFIALILLGVDCLSTALLLQNLTKNLQILTMFLCLVWEPLCQGAALNLPTLATYTSHLQNL